MSSHWQDEPRDWHGRWTDAGASIRAAASDRLRDEGLEQFTVGYAPFREGDISNLEEGQRAFQNEKYKAWREQGSEIAKLLGLQIIEDNPSIGIYEATSNNAEASRVIEVKGEKKLAESYAAIMGAIAPDKQNSVMVNRYDPNGDASEHYITFKDRNAAISFVNNRKNFGIGDVSYFPDKNKVMLLDFGNFDKLKTFQTYGQQISNVEERKVSTRFIEENEYAGIVQNVRSELSGHNTGTLRKKLDHILTIAEERSTGRKIKPK